MSTINVNTLRTAAGASQVLVSEIAKATDLAAPTGSSLVGYMPAGAGAVGRTLQDKGRESVSAIDRGASSAGVIDSTTAFTNALSDSNVVTIPSQGTAYAGTAVVIIPATKLLRGENKNGPTVAASLKPASQTRIERLNLASASPVLASSSNLADVTVADNKIIASGYGIQIEGSNNAAIDIKGNLIQAVGYGVLLGGSTTAADGGGLIRVTGNTVTSTASGDALELNYPYQRTKGFIVANNFFSVSGSPTPTAGFGIGVAAAEQAVFVGNVVTASINEAFHIEDSTKNVSVVGNSFTGTTHGLVVYPATQVGNTRSPTTIVGNTANTLTIGSHKGYYLFNTAPATVQAHALVGNVARDYLDGYFIGAGNSGNHAVNLISGNIADNCTSAIAGDGTGAGFWTVQAGENLANNCTNLFRSSGSNCFFGKVVSATTPIAISATVSYGAGMPSRMDGFAYPIGSINTSVGLVNLMSFKIGARLFGRIRYAVKRTGTADWAHYSATLKWDGTTLTITDKVIRISGTVITDINAVHSAGSLFLQANCASGATLNSGWVDFDGEYWDV